MRITKHLLDHMVHCYCAGSLIIDGVPHAVLAGEDRGAACYAYAAPDFTQREALWENRGGTMCLIPLPGRDGEFLAVENFFPVFQSETAKLVWGRKEAGQWVLRDFLSLPYVHRFDILTSGGRQYLFAATLCTSKQHQDDWSDPGALYACPLPDDLTQTPRPERLLGGMVRNHGYWRGTWEGRQAAFTACDSGVYVSLPPLAAEEGWAVQHLLDGPVSDIALCDIDGDGLDEMALISPFHGDALTIYHQKNGGWEPVFQLTAPFAHALWGGTLLGRPAFLVGARRGDCALSLIRWDADRGFSVTALGHGGSSNVSVFSLPGQDVVVSANHTAGEAAVYVLEDVPCETSPVTI